VRMGAKPVSKTSSIPVHKEPESPTENLSQVESQFHWQPHPPPLFDKEIGIGHLLKFLASFRFRRVRSVRSGYHW
jgi:hypothetical protein